MIFGCVRERRPVGIKEKRSNDMGTKDGGKKPGSGNNDYYKSLITYMIIMLVISVMSLYKNDK